MDYIKVIKNYLNKLKILKYKTKSLIGVITFDPIPKMFFNKNLKNYRISNFSQKINLFTKFNVDFIINKKFDKKFSKINYFKIY